MNKRTRKVHAIAVCQDCGAEWRCPTNTAACAAVHAKATGHRVTGEVGLAFEYDGGGKPTVSVRGKYRSKEQVKK